MLLGFAVFHNHLTRNRVNGRFEQTGKGHPFLLHYFRETQEHPAAEVFFY